MNPNEVLRIVDAIHRDKKIDTSIVFDGIEAALISAARKHYGEDGDIVIDVNRETGLITGSHNGVEMTPEDIAERIGAQTAKQVMIQKIREAERDALYEEYVEQMDQMVSGVIQRYDGGAATVALGNVEAILPRSEQIQSETYHPNQRIRATICEVKKAGSRIKVILSRTRSHLIARLFEQEIPEITDGVIEVKAIAREPGHRSKVAVHSSDQRVDCVGACVGVRGNRIKNIVEELSGERIDIVRYNDDMQLFIPNALQPAEVEEVILCQAFGRAIVLVREDQLSLAIGRRGQNVRLGSKLCIWDIEIMTREELDEQIERAIIGFMDIEGMPEEVAEQLVGEGFLSYDDLSVIEPDVLQQMGDLSDETVNLIVEQAEAKAEQAEREAATQRREQKEQERNKVAADHEAELAEAAAAEAAPDTAAEETAEPDTAAPDTAAEETAEPDTAEPDTAAEEAEEELPVEEVLAEEVPVEELEEATSEEPAEEPTEEPVETSEEKPADEVGEAETSTEKE